MKNKKIEQLIVCARQCYAKLKSRVPNQHGVFSWADLKYKFDPDTGIDCTDYCDFDVFINGRCYYVDVASIDFVKKCKTVLVCDDARYAGKSDQEVLANGKSDILVHCSNGRYNYVDCVVACKIKCLDDIYKIQQAVIQYIKSRNKQDFVNATADS